MERINFVGAPGVGKSVAAAKLYADMALLGNDVELITEVAKIYTYTSNYCALKNQILIFGEQMYREYMASNHDYIITDSPLLLNAFWAEYRGYDYDLVKSLVNLALDKNISHQRKITVDRYIFLELPEKDKYKSVGRNESYSEAQKIEKRLLMFMRKHHRKEFLPQTLTTYLKMTS